MANNTISLLQKTLSLGLLLFSIILVSALIFQEQQTTLSKRAPHPIVAYLILWIALLWLSMVEGSQASLVGLPPVDRELYQKTHPIAFQICQRAHYGDNLDRYLIGRQFMVLALVFVINLCGAPVIDDNDQTDILGLPTVVTDAFLNSGLAMIIMTAVIGQLTTQINASHCMLDYLNTHFATCTVWIALAIEASGLLHASYLIQYLVAKLAGKGFESNEHQSEGHEQNDDQQSTSSNTTKSQPTIGKQFLFGVQVAMSCALLIFALVVTLAALFDGQTTLWPGIPKPVAVIIFVGLMAVVGMLEGMQIAFFAVSKLTDEQRKSNVWAKWSCDLLFDQQQRGLPGFMIGRQLCVVACFFVVARVTTIQPKQGNDNPANVLGLGDAAQTFFETGLLGAFLTTILASIAWQLLASAFPRAFLGNPLTYGLLRLCLIVEATGIASGSWALASLHKKCAGYRRDELYIGTAEERAAQGHEDHPLHTNEVGHLTGGAYPANHDLPTPSHDATRHPVDYTHRRKVILNRIARLREQIKHAPEAQRENLEFALKLEVRNLKSWNEKQEFFMTPTSGAGGFFNAAPPPPPPANKSNNKDDEEEGDDDDDCTNTESPSQSLSMEKPLAIATIAINNDNNSDLSDDDKPQTDDISTVEEV